MAGKSDLRNQYAGMNDAGGYPVAYLYPVIKPLKTNEMSIGWAR